MFISKEKYDDLMDRVAELIELDREKLKPSLEDYVGKIVEITTCIGDENVKGVRGKLIKCRSTYETYEFVWNYYRVLHDNGSILIENTSQIKDVTIKVLEERVAELEKKLENKSKRKNRKK